MTASVSYYYRMATYDWPRGRRLSKRWT